MAVTFTWRGPIDNDVLNRLHAEGFGTRVFDTDWAAQLERHSAGWVTAYDEGRLVGFVNVAWDGGVHAFVLDTLVAADRRREGLAGSSSSTRPRARGRRPASGCTSTGTTRSSPRSTSRAAASCRRRRG